MTDPGYRYCPRCGTALVAGMPFCPRCGLNSADVDDRAAPPGAPGDPSFVAFGGSVDEDLPATTRPAASNEADPWVAGPPSAPAGRGFTTRAMPIILGALVIAAGIVVYGLLTRPPAGGSAPAAPQGGSSIPGGQVEPGASPVGPPAPIVGITFQSPQEGQAVATEEVTVIGIAPPGLTVTRDISFGLDQHATADGTGHWAINVRLQAGENVLVFRLGDDRSTEQRLRVSYTPPQ